MGHGAGNKLKVDAYHSGALLKLKMPVMCAHLCSKGLS